MAKFVVDGNGSTRRLLFELVKFPSANSAERGEIQALRCRWCQWTFVYDIAVKGEIPTHECSGPPSTPTVEQLG